ncbi:hypothetical protein [Spirosoma migulaei]
MLTIFTHPMIYTAVEQFLQQIKVKADKHGLAFLEKPTNNLDQLLEMNLTVAQRTSIIKGLSPEDYSTGPYLCNLHPQYPSMVFGRTLQKGEVFIELSKGVDKAPVMCRAFRWASKKLIYPFKNKILV